jgi:hypothetical protein
MIPPIGDVNALFGGVSRRGLSDGAEQMPMIFHEASVLHHHEMVRGCFLGGAAAPRSGWKPYGLSVLASRFADMVRDRLRPAEDHDKIDGSPEVIESRVRRQSADSDAIEPNGNDVVPRLVEVRHFQAAVPPRPRARADDGNSPAAAEQSLDKRFVTIHVFHGVSG